MSRRPELPPIDADLEARGYYRDERGSVIPIKYRSPPKEVRVTVSESPKDQLATWLAHSPQPWRPEWPFTGVTGDRKYRFDWALPERLVAIEYQGIGRGHQWANEQAKDWCKLTEAQLCGWLVILCSAVTINDGRFAALLDRVISERVP